MTRAARAGTLAGLLIVLALVGIYVLAQGGSQEEAPATAPRLAASNERSVSRVTCSDGSTGSSRVGRDDIAVGPLLFVGGRAWARSEPDAFDRNGFKVPVTLRRGARATVSVPPSMRGRVGLVFTPKAQERVSEKGVRGADTSVHFTACPTATRSGRTGWPGGLAVDRRRCAVVAISVADGAPVRRRLPLGRRC